MSKFNFKFFEKTCEKTCVRPIFYLKICFALAFLCNFLIFTVLRLRRFFLFVAPFSKHSTFYMEWMLGIRVFTQKFTFAPQQENSIKNDRQNEARSSHH